MMNIIFYITGLLLVLIVGLIVSEDRRKIRYKPIVIML